LKRHSSILRQKAGTVFQRLGYHRLVRNYDQAWEMDRFDRFIFLVVIPVSILAICCLAALLFG
jgi:hypothetical protein